MWHMSTLCFKIHKQLPDASLPKVLQDSYSKRRRGRSLLRPCCNLRGHLVTSAWILLDVPPPVFSAGLIHHNTPWLFGPLEPLHRSLAAHRERQATCRHLSPVPAVTHQQTCSWKACWVCVSRGGANTPADHWCSLVYSSSTLISALPSDGAQSEAVLFPV